MSFMSNNSLLLFQDQNETRFVISESGAIAICHQWRRPKTGGGEHRVYPFRQIFYNWLILFSTILSSYIADNTDVYKNEKLIKTTKQRNLSLVTIRASDGVAISERVGSV
jgi:hypothetical protein